MFRVFILIMHLGQPSYIWMSNAQWDTKVECQKKILPAMLKLRTELEEDYMPLVGICDTKTNMDHKENRDDRPS